MLMRVPVRPLLLVLSLAGTSTAAQEVTTDPDHVRIEVGDIRRLADVVRALATGSPADTAGIIEREYLAGASPGLRAYASSFNVTATSIADALSADPSRYADLDVLADLILAQGAALRAAFRRLLELHPEAVFPTIWFVVGHNGPGGLARPEGVLVAAERYAGHLKDIVPLELHELAHIQQAVVQGIDTYRRIYGPDQTLLALALREGSAELIAVLTSGQHLNVAGERYGLAHEYELWTRFREEMHHRELGDWMFVRPSNPDWLPDLGHWIGYRIAKSFYDRAEDKREAVRAILALTDFEAFLAASGYNGGSR